MPTPDLRKPIVCADGFRLSVQASVTHYCTPRDNIGPYFSVEVMSDGSEPLLGTPGKYDDGITGWIPARTVLSVIFKHGGIVEGELPPLAFKGSQNNETE